MPGLGSWAPLVEPGASSAPAAVLPILGCAPVRPGLCSHPAPVLFRPAWGLLR